MTDHPTAATTEHSETSKPTIPRVPWSGWWAVFYVVVTFYVTQLLAGVIVLLYPLTKGWSDTKSIDWLNDSVPAQFFYVLLAETLTVLALYFYLRHYRKTFKIIGLLRPRWRDIKYGLLAVLPYYVIYLLTVGVVSALVSGFDADQTQEIGFNGAGGWGLVLVFVSLVILPPIVEEIMVRGFLYSSLRKAVPLGWAVFLTSAIFAAAHLPEGGAAGPLYVAAVDTFVLSLVLIYLREKTGSLWASITLHTVKNGVAFMLLFVFHVG
jgi:membrane protease YdiL (CAAX protease family)